MLLFHLVDPSIQWQKAGKLYRESLVGQFVSASVSFLTLVRPSKRRVQLSSYPPDLLSIFSTLGYLGVQVFQYGIGGFSEERKVASMGPLKQLISLLTPEDSNIWDTVKMIFARKGTEPSMPTGQEPGRLTVEDALNKLVEARPGFEGPLRL